MSRLIRIAAIGVALGVAAQPALAQSYGYGTPAPAYNGAPQYGGQPQYSGQPQYGAPPPAGGPPPAEYGPPPGSRCDASFDGEYRRHRFVCPMRVAKPVGAPCRCLAPPPAPGYPPRPPARGRVIP